MRATLHFLGRTIGWITPRAGGGMKLQASPAGPTGHPEAVWRHYALNMLQRVAEGHPDDLDEAWLRREAARMPPNPDDETAPYLTLEEDADPQKYARADLRDRITAAGARVDPNPTAGRRKVLNFQHGHVTVHGIPIALEVPPGGLRRGIGKAGPWERALPAGVAYGRIKRTEGKDGEPVDVFLGPHPESELVFVIDQVTPGGRFDEHKAVMGMRNEREAREAYRACYPRDWTGLGAITPLTLPAFKAWLQDGDLTKRVAGSNISYSGAWSEGGMNTPPPERSAFRPAPLEAPPPALQEPRPASLPTAPTIAHAPAAVLKNPAKVRQAFRGLFGVGSGHRLADVPSWAGVPDDATEVTIQPHEDNPDHLHVLWKHPHLHHEPGFSPFKGIADSVVGRDDDGKFFVKLENIFIDPKHQGNRLGARVVARQLEQAQKAGADYATLHAARGNPPDPSKPHAGFYVWPLFGYDESLEEVEQEPHWSSYNPGRRSPRELVAEIRDRFPDVKSILDLYHTPGGRQWWKENGVDLTNMKFDLDPDSRSWEQFNDYRRESHTSGKPF